LQGSKKKLVDDLINDFKHLGVDLDNDRLTEFRNLKQRISRLSSEYSNNMNASDEVLILDEAGAEGLSEDFKSTYVNDENKYVIPIINATRTPVLGNATSEETRKAYYMLFYNRAADANLRILDSLIVDRYELAEIMGYPSFAAYSLSQKMAKNPESVWDFTYNLTNLAKVKASADLEKLRKLKAETVGEADAKLYPWDILYYKNEILKKEYDVDKEALRAYFPMQESLAGMFEIYQNLLGLEFRKVENPSVWHEDVDMYEVYEGDSLKGRFYLDLYPRANKESWFYGVGITPGKLTENGYEVPVSMLLGNFTKGTEQLPSLLSLDELNILFHEFGHIVNGMSYDGAFALQSESENDFVESMSQIFENWVWDYDILKTFAKHYQTGEVLPKEVFENLLAGKNITSGYDAVGSLRYCLYDMNLYDKYNPEDPIDTDELWKSIDDELGLIPLYAEGTHPQASWIHINTHPVYYYGYLWSEVYAQDMFTEFEKNGLQDSVTGIKYRKVVLSNGTQRDIEGSVEEFLGRPANNKAYIKSLGLE
jgi:thimet oligopeptidase